MNKEVRVGMISGVLLLTFSTNVHATSVITSYGTFSESVVYTYDGSRTRRVASVDDVGIQQTSASTSIDDPLLGQGASSTGFSGPSYLPAVSAYSISRAGSQVGARSLAVQSFVVSPGVTSITVNAMVDFSGSGGDPFLSGSSGWVTAYISALSSSTGSLDFSTCPIATFPGGDNFESFTTALLCLSLPDEAQEDWTEVTQLARTDYYPDGATTASVPLTMTFAVNPGDTIYIQSYLGALSRDGGFVNASRTLTAVFSDDTAAVASLQENTFAPVNYPVPEPGTLALLGLGLAGLALSRRRKA